MKLPKSMLQVTPISKSLAALTFIILPFVTFFLGMYVQAHYDIAEDFYKLKNETKTYVVSTSTPTPTQAPTLTPNANVTQPFVPSVTPVSSSLQYKQILFDLVKGTNTWKVTDSVSDPITCFDGLKGTPEKYKVALIELVDVQNFNQINNKVDTTLLSNGWTRCGENKAAAGTGASFKKDGKLVVYNWSSTVGNGTFFKLHYEY